MAVSLIVHLPGQGPVTHDLVGSEVNIGRNDDNDIIVTERGISGNHARVLVSENNITLIDLDSTNGTYVNAERLCGPRPIQSSDEIVLCDVRLEFVVQGAPVRNPPVQSPGLPASQPSELTGMTSPPPLLAGAGLDERMDFGHSIETTGALDDGPPPLEPTSSRPKSLFEPAALDATMSPPASLNMSAAAPEPGVTNRLESQTKRASTTPAALPVESSLGERTSEPLVAAFESTSQPSADTEAPPSLNQPPLLNRTGGFSEPASLEQPTSLEQPPLIPPSAPSSFESVATTRSPQPRPTPGRGPTAQARAISDLLSPGQAAPNLDAARPSEAGIMMPRDHAATRRVSEPLLGTGSLEDTRPAASPAVQSASSLFTGQSRTTTVASVSATSLPTSIDDIYRATKVWLNESFEQRPGSAEQRAFVRKGLEVIGCSPVEIEDTIDRMMSEIHGDGVIGSLLELGDVSSFWMNGHQRMHFRQGPQTHAIEPAFSCEAAFVDVVARWSGVDFGVRCPVVETRTESNYWVRVLHRSRTGTTPVLVANRTAPADTDINSLAVAGCLSPEVGQLLSLAIEHGRTALVCSSAGCDSSPVLGALMSVKSDNQRTIFVGGGRAVPGEHEAIVLRAHQPDEFRAMLDVALQLDPDRIFVNRVSSWEAGDVLSAISRLRGAGVMGVSAGSVRDGISRLASMIQLGRHCGPDVAKRYLLSALDLIVVLGKTADGLLRVVEVAQSSEDEDGELQVQSLFKFDVSSCSWVTQGIEPAFYGELRAMGHSVGDSHQN